MYGIIKSTCGGEGFGKAKDFRVTSSTNSKSPCRRDKLCSFITYTDCCRLSFSYCFTISPKTFRNLVRYLMFSLISYVDFLFYVGKGCVKSDISNITHVKV